MISLNPIYDKINYTIKRLNVNSDKNKEIM